MYIKSKLEAPFCHKQPTAEGYKFPTVWDGLVWPTLNLV